MAHTLLNWTNTTVIGGIGIGKLRYKSANSVTWIKVVLNQLMEAIQLHMFLVL